MPSQAHYIHFSCVLPLFLSVLLCSFPSSCASESPRANTFVVGAVCDSFLKYAQFDQQVCNGAKWWVNWVNSRGGLSYGGVTRQVTLISLDTSQPDNSKTFAIITAAYERLVTEFKAELLLSPASTMRAAAAIAVSEKYKIINLSVAALAENLYFNTSYLFGLNIPINQIPIGPLQMLLDRGAKTYVIFTTNDPLPMSVSQVAINFLNKSGATMLSNVQFNCTVIENSDFTELRHQMATHLQQSPDIFIFSSLPSDISSVFFAFNELRASVSSAVFLIPTSTSEQKMNEMDKVGDYWIGSSRWTEGFNYGVDGVLGGTTQQFVHDYTKTMGFSPVYLDVLTAGSLMSYFHAVDVSATTNSDVIATTMRTMGRIETFATPIWYSDTGVNQIAVEVVVQNKIGHGVVVDANTLIYPAPWPWKAGMENVLFLAFAVPIGAVILLVTIVALFFVRYQKSRAVEALSKTEEGERRNYRIDYRLLTTGPLIGSGSFGNVYRGEYRGADVCIKKLKCQNFTKQQRNVFAQEASMMVTLRHPNIVLFMGVCLEVPRFCIITEYMQKGSLYDVLHDKTVSLDLPMIKNMALDILKGLHFIHSAGIIHRDLKSPNLLVDRNWTIKIADFGLSCTKAEANGVTQLSLLWAAPEILLNQKGCYTEKSDVYSFGIILWEILSRKVPYEGLSIAAIPPAVIGSHRPPLRHDWPAEVVSLMTSCWHSIPSLRPAVKEARHVIEAPTEDMTIDPERCNAIDHTRTPPSGNVTFVCSTVQQIPKLWHAEPWETAKAITLINDQLRTLIALYGGFELRSDGMSVIIAFADCNEALAFCLRAQKVVLNIAWPEVILNSHETCQMRDSSSEVMFRGISLQMGVHAAVVMLVEKERGTGNISYQGPGLNVASSLASIAGRGQIMLSVETFSKISASDKRIDAFYVENLGPRKVDTDIMSVCVVLPSNLKGRILLTTPRSAEGSPLSTSTLSAYSTASLLTDSSVSSSSKTPSFAQRITSEFRPTSLLRLRADSGKSKVDPEKIQNQDFVFPAQPAPWIVPLEDLILGPKLGHVAVGEIFSGTLQKQDGISLVVLERFVKQRLSDATLLHIRAESSVLFKLQHENIVTFLGVCLTSPYMGLILKLNDRSPLSHMLYNRDSILDWNMKFQFAIEIAKGMLYLHENGTLHTDLRSANIMVTSDMKIKICEFGFQEIKKDIQAMTQTATVCWVAPEIFSGSSFTQKSDVFSYGMVLYELIFNQTPWAGDSSMDVVYKVTKGLRPNTTSLSAQTPKALICLMKACWIQQTADRPTFVDIIAELDPKVLSDV